MGRRGLHVLLEEISGGERRKQELVTPELIVRKSAAPPSDADATRA
jgi:DNA-binding LacI/PurR family transcriptional regulator